MEVAFCMTNFSNKYFPFSYLSLVDFQSSLQLSCIEMSVIMKFATSGAQHPPTISTMRTVTLAALPSSRYRGSKDPVI